MMRQTQIPLTFPHNIMCRRVGRAAVLSAMLDRPRIFHSLWALTVGMEERARFNLAEEIKRLQV